MPLFKNKPFFLNIILFGLIGLQVSIYAFIWGNLLKDPSLKGMDFISFYTAGRIANQGKYHELFDLDTQRSIQWEVVSPDTFPGGVNLSQHPPYLSPLLAIVMSDDFVQAYVRWSMVRLLTVGVVGYLVWKFLLVHQWKSWHAGLYAASFVSFFPFFLGWLGGQDTVFIILGLLFWTFGMVDHKDAQAGGGLALASLSPLVALAFGAPMLAARKKPALWFILSMIGLGLYSLALVGFEGGKEFIDLMLLSSKGEGFGLNQPAMYNFLGFLLRLFPSSFEGFLRLFSWLSFVTFLLGFAWLWWRWRNNLRLEHIGITVLLGTFLLPHLHVHGLSYLLIPALALAMLLYAKGKHWAALLFLPLASTLMMFLSFLASLTANYAAYYLFMIFLFLNLWKGIHHPIEGV